MKYQKVGDVNPDILCIYIINVYILIIYIYTAYIERLTFINGQDKQWFSYSNNKSCFQMINYDM